MLECLKGLFEKDRGPGKEKKYKPNPNSKYKKIALIPGHSPKKYGTRTYNKNKEFFENRKIIELILAAEDVIGKKLVYIERKELGYSSAMSDLAKRAKEHGADVAIEFHYNAASIPEARGCEMLIKDGADESARLGKKIVDEFAEKFNLKQRRQYKGMKGIKPLKRGARGGGFCWKMEAKGIRALLWEPFFCDYRNEETKQFLDDPAKGRKIMADFWIKQLKEM